jgi:hypothetical protein
MAVRRLECRRFGFAIKTSLLSYMVGRQAAAEIAAPGTK